ncbi:MAG: HD domain-containing protein [Planctomycetaceae bacterium]
MSTEKLRRRITFEAARLMHQRQETDFQRAKVRAARTIYRGWIKSSDLPSDREIRHELLRFSRTGEGDPTAESLRDMPLDAAAGNAVEFDRFDVYRANLVPLAKVKQNAARHPEGDVLYHSLQVFQLARDAVPYDEEFLLAALLHDVGKGIDARDHVRAGLAALDGFITERTAWFIENHLSAQAVHQGTIGARARRRLQQTDDYDELMLLAECDRAGRETGVPVPELDEALEFIRELADTNG